MNFTERSTACQDEPNKLRLSIHCGPVFRPIGHSIPPWQPTSRIGWNIGHELAERARERPMEQGGREAVILWASDTVRDEGAMIAFGLALLGVEPIWNSRGIVEGIKRMPTAAGRERRDLMFTTSGLFRDLYADQLALLERGVLLALDGASETIRRDYPALRTALDAALQPLGPLANAGNESLQLNLV